MNEVMKQTLPCNDEIDSVVQKLFDDRPNMVEKAKTDFSVFGWFVGHVMKETHGKANPEVVVEKIKAKLESDHSENTTSAILSGNYVADWRLSEGRRIERSMSALEVPPRMDVSLTLKDRRGDNYDDFGVIGGYTEFLEKSPVAMGGGREVMLYQPVFHITTWKSVTSAPGALVILLAAFAPSIYHSNFWLTQWAQRPVGKNQLGFLEEDLDRPGRAIVLKNPEESIEFAKAYFSTPLIVIDSGGECDVDMGGNNVVGMIEDIILFSHKNGSNKSGKISTPLFGPSGVVHNVGHRTVGHFVDESDVTRDSREADYFYVADTIGWGAVNKSMRKTLLGISDPLEDRPKIITSIYGNFIPDYTIIHQMINPQVVKWLISSIHESGIKIVDPTSRPSDVSSPFTKLTNILT